MSEVEKLKVTLEVPASEFIDHDGGLLVRCPLNGAWVPLKDYYSEQQGALLPLVGNVDYEEAGEHWVDSGEVEKQGDGVTPKLNADGSTIPVMRKEGKENPIVWKETIRVLAKVAEEAPEGGTLAFNVSDSVSSKDKFGG